MHCRLWILGRREISFFFVGPGRDIATILTPSAAQVPPAGSARCAPSGITRPQSPPCEPNSPTLSFTNSTAVLFAALDSYNTAVVGPQGHMLVGGFVEMMTWTLRPPWTGSRIANANRPSGGERCRVTRRRCLQAHDAPKECVGIDEDFHL